MTDTFIKLPQPQTKERSSFTATAYFRDSADAAEAPTTIDYRIDDLSTGEAILGWTSGTPGTSLAISVTAAQNKIVNSSNNWERRQLTVSADRGLATETRDTAEWRVVNIGGWNE